MNENERLIFSAIVNNTNDISIPQFKEDRYKDWVKYGNDNKFPDELLDLYNSSGIHNTIIYNNVNMIVGDGVIQTNENEYSERTQSFIENPNPYESLDDILRKVSLDYQIFGLSYLEIIWGKGHKKISKIYHMDATKIRWSKLNNHNKIDKFYFSRDWDNYRKSEYIPIEIPLFGSGKNREILPIVKYTPGMDYYTYPSYIGGLKWINIDIEISTFHLNNLQNGMSPNVLFTFPVGETTDEERKQIENKIKEKYTGTNNAGKFIVAFYDAEGSNKPEVKVLETSNSDKLYDLLNKTTLQQILISHNVVNENLVGISTPGKLGNSNELLNSYDIYFNTTIKPDQNKIIDAFKRIFLINGLNDIQILNNKPFDFQLSEGTLNLILTKDELRDMIGFKPLSSDSGQTSDQIDSISGETSLKYDFGVRVIDATNYNYALEKANLNDFYKWDLRNEDNPCPSCKGFDGNVRTLKEWKDIAIPGAPSGFNFGNEITKFPYGDGKFGTFCEDNCKCRLVKIGSTKK